jgi:predicted Zn-dependent protease
MKAIIALSSVICSFALVISSANAGSNKKNAYWKIDDNYFLSVEAPTANEAANAFVAGIKGFYDNSQNEINARYDKSVKAIVVLVSKKFSLDKSSIRVTVGISLIDKFGEVVVSRRDFTYDIDKDDKGLWKTTMIVADTKIYE